MRAPPSLDELRDALETADRFQAAKYLSAHPDLHPRYLYKFASSHTRGLLGAIVRSELWLASRQDFNDPFEMHIRISFDGSEAEKLRYLRHAARRNRIPLGMRSKFAEATLKAGGFELSAKQSYESNVNSWGVCCFGTDVRSVLMWGYYAKQQRGICYQFHSARSPVPFAEALPVKYSDEVIRLNWLEEWTIERKLGQSFFTKAKAWEHEGEHRIIARGAARTPLKFRPDALVGIVVGSMAPRFTELRVVAACRRRCRAGLPAVRLFRAVPHESLKVLRIARATDLEALAFQNHR